MAIIRIMTIVIIIIRNFKKNKKLLVFSTGFFVLLFGDSQWGKNCDILIVNIYFFLSEVCLLSFVKYDPNHSTINI